ncbi:hypothetical protein [Nonomuraea diastatica]|uniref:hypothetical protein n=1 Tax=Nonomuraea diastatica TaxID=1848329 RepID=UPI001C7086CE|nr:hypothetical protein [Nonomuraea diastatica]
MAGGQQQLADHQGGHRQGQRLDQVDRVLAGGEHVVDEVVDDVLDAGAQRGQPLHGELADQRTPGRGVFRAGHADHRRWLAAELLLDRRIGGEEREAVPLPVGGGAAVGEDGAAFLMPGHPTPHPRWSGGSC